MRLEVRPGEGGADAALFADELTDAICAYARRKGIEVQPLDDCTKMSAARLVGKTKPIAALVGTHRVQRIPKGDKRGRRHTSTATVALVDETEVDFSLREADIEWWACRGTGAGGQHRNTRDTAVTYRHIPTGITVRGDSRSQDTSREIALTELTRRLEARAREEARTHTNDQRRSQIASAERPVKEFTWNEQRDEVIDHGSGRRWPMKKAFKGRF